MSPLSGDEAAGVSFAEVVCGSVIGEGGFTGAPPGRSLRNVASAPIPPVGETRTNLMERGMSRSSTRPAPNFQTAGRC
jgi:hypothetical protein